MSKKVTLKPEDVRSISDIAVDIHHYWKKVNPHAEPYLRAMFSLHDMSDMYGLEDANMIVAYFLNNAQGWRGEEARRIKKELNDMLDLYSRGDLR